MKSNTQIKTQDGARISKRLLNHWKHKFEVSESPEQMQIFMPDHTITLKPQAEYLDVFIDSKLDNLSQIQDVVLNHLNRMAQHEFNAVWQ